MAIILIVAADNLGAKMGSLSWSWSIALNPPNPQTINTDRRPLQPDLLRQGLDGEDLAGSLSSTGKTISHHIISFFIFRVITFTSLTWCHICIARHTLSSIRPITIFQAYLALSFS